MVACLTTWPTFFGSRFFNGDNCHRCLGDVRSIDQPNNDVQMEAGWCRLSRMKRCTRIWLTVAAVAVGIVLLSIVAVAAHTSLRDGSFRQRTFDSISWKTGDVRTRGEMVASLLGQPLLFGRNRDEVLAVLGKPDEDHETLFLYRVDVGRRILWRPFLETLVVQLDGKMRVSRFDTVDGLSTLPPKP